MPHRAASEERVGTVQVGCAKHEDPSSDPPTHMNETDL